jgi:hypothetical protein
MSDALNHNSFYTPKLAQIPSQSIIKSTATTPTHTPAKLNNELVERDENDINTKFSKSKETPTVNSIGANATPVPSDYAAIPSMSGNKVNISLSFFFVTLIDSLKQITDSPAPRSLSEQAKLRTITEVLTANLAPKTPPRRPYSEVFSASAIAEHNKQRSSPKNKEKKDLEPPIIAESKSSTRKESKAQRSKSRGRERSRNRNSLNDKEGVDSLLHHVKKIRSEQQLNSMIEYLQVV